MKKLTTSYLYYMYKLMFFLMNKQHTTHYGLTF